LLILGILCFGVGLLVAMPIGYLADIYIYKKFAENIDTHKDDK